MGARRRMGFAAGMSEREKDQSSAKKALADQKERVCQPGAKLHHISLSWRSQAPAGMSAGMGAEIALGVEV